MSNMQGVGDSQDIGENRKKRIVIVAFMAALTLHILILLVRLDVPSPILRADRTLLLTLEQDPASTQLESRIEPQDMLVSSAAPLPTEVEPANPSIEVLQPEIISTADSEAEDIIKIPSLNSDEFRRFIQSETQNAINSNPKAVTGFAESFIAPVKPEFEDIDSETGPLGGGAYDVRKNGMECQTLKMVKQSFDEINGAPTISTSGACKDLKKKFNLLDQDGKIKNSDRYDW